MAGKEESKGPKTIQNPGTSTMVIDTDNKKRTHEEFEKPQLGKLRILQTITFTSRQKHLITILMLQKGDVLPFERKEAISTH